MIKSGTRVGFVVIALLVAMTSGLGSVDPIFDPTGLPWKDELCKKCDPAAVYTCKNSGCGHYGTWDFNLVKVNLYVKFTKDPGLVLNLCKKVPQPNVGLIEKRKY